MDESVRAKLETRVARLEQQIKAFKELHASELGLILDELAALRAELVAMRTPAPDAASTAAPNVGDASTPRDPAAASPKRAAWLAEQERKERERQTPLSRRELLRGREREESG
jgi:hypothetical protein